MVPQAKRRPGFSRRRQYGLFIAQVVAVAGLLAGALLVFLARFDPPALLALRGGALDLSRPLVAAFGGAMRGIDRGGEAVGDYLHAGADNARLRGELAASERALITARVQAAELARLRALLKLVEPERRPVVVARLVGSTASGPRRTAILTAGSRDGVRPGQPVRSAEGLVGRVLDTGLTAARVLLVTDEGSVVPVQVARNGAPALAIGTGGAALQLKALLGGPTPFRRGDLVVTSGTGGLYPPGVPLAVITVVGGDDATAWPLADPRRLDYAAVEPAFEQSLPRAWVAPAP